MIILWRIVISLIPNLTNQSKLRLTRLVDIKYCDIANICQCHVARVIYQLAQTINTGNIQSRVSPPSDWDRRQLEERHSWSWLRSGLIDVRIVGECQIMKIVSQQKPNVPKLQITNLVSAGCHIVTEGQYNSRAVLGKYSKIKISFFIQLKSSPLANAGSMRLKVWNWGRWWMGISF